MSNGAIDLARYQDDIEGFARDVLNISVHPGQVRLFKAVSKRRGGPLRRIAKWLTLVLASGNRAGKTTALAVVIIHSCLFKTNLTSTWDVASMSPAEFARRWARAEYHWYHFGILHEVADLVFNEVVRLLTGVHMAQGDGGCPLTRMGGQFRADDAQPVATWDVKEYGDYRWVKWVNGAELHFRTTSEKALGQLGRDMHGISFDEAGLEPRLDFLVDEVFDFRRLGTGGQLIMVSTPSEDLGTSFPNHWENGNPENPYRNPNNLSLRMSTRDNIGFGLTQDMFDILVAGWDERKIKQNVEGYFLQSKGAYFHGANVDRVFANNLPERMPVRVKRVGPTSRYEVTIYLHGIDPAKTQDSAWSIVLMVVPDPQVGWERPHLVGVRAEQRRGQKSTETLVALATDAFLAYDVPRVNAHCYTATDATGFGGKMFREALDKEVPNVTNVEFGGTIQKKRKLLGDLRTLIDSGRLHLPRRGIWKQVRKQLLGYKLEDRGIEQDAVMALVCAVYLMKRVPADGANSQAFDLSGAA